MNRTTNIERVIVIITKTILMLVVATGGLTAQTIWRKNRTIELGSPVTDQVLWIGRRQSFKAIPATAGLVASSTVATSIPLAGGAVFVGAPTPPAMILSGRDPGTDEGVLELFVWDTNNLLYTSPPSGGSYREAGSDFVGLAWSVSGLMYLLDARKKRIVFAPYQPGASLPAVWSVLIDDTVAPVLGAADDLAMSARETGSAIDLRLYDHFEHGADRHTIALSPSGVAVALEGGFRDRAAAIDDGDLLVGRSWVRVFGPPTTPLSVVHMSGATPPPVLGTATTDAQGSAIVTLSSPLAAGEIYGTLPQTLAEPAPPFGTPVFRDGAAEDIDSGSTIRPFLSGLAMTAFVDSRHFRVPIWIDPEAPAQVVVPATYTGYLNVGSAGDIVTLPDGRRFLASPVTVSTDIEVWDHDKPGFGVVKLPIQDDPALANGLVYFQWVVIVGSNAKLSDIMGFPIRVERWVRPGSTLFGGTNILSGGSGAGSGSFAEAFAIWLRSAGFRRLSRQEKSALNRMLDR
jgi:hypothetical protein